jgi:hypothetical protein
MGAGSIRLRSECRRIRGCGLPPLHQTMRRRRTLYRQASEGWAMNAARSTARSTPEAILTSSPATERKRLRIVGSLLMVMSARLASVTCGPHVLSILSTAANCVFIRVGCTLRTSSSEPPTFARVGVWLPGALVREAHPTMKKRNSYPRVAPNR